MAKQIEFSPAIPIPLVFDVEEHIKQLRNCLDPKHPFYQPKEQHVNVKAVIKLYEEKKIDGFQEVWLIDGKVVSEEEAEKRTGFAWHEVCLFIFVFSSLRTYLTNRLKLQGMRYQY